MKRRELTYPHSAPEFLLASSTCALVGRQAVDRQAWGTEFAVQGENLSGTAGTKLEVCVTSTPAGTFTPRPVTQPDGCSCGLWMPGVWVTRLQSLWHDCSRSPHSWAGSGCLPVSEGRRREAALFPKLSLLLILLLLLLLLLQSHPTLYDP